MYYRSNRWEIGNDPMLVELVETSDLPRPENYSTAEAYGYDRLDNDIIYAVHYSGDFGNMGIWKYTFVPNDNGIHDDEWGETGGYVEIATDTNPKPYKGNTGALTDGTYIYNHFCHYEQPYSYFFVVDREGYMVETIETTDFYVRPDEQEGGGDYAPMLNSAEIRNSKVYMHSHRSCMNSMVDPIAGLEDEGDFYVFHNQNGDFFLDHNSEATATQPWVCYDLNVAPFTYSCGIDANMITAVHTNNFGNISFAVVGPDGTGFGYHSYAGETDLDKRGTKVIDNGSAFDGLYSDNQSQVELPAGYEGDPGDYTEDFEGGAYFVAHDSINGTITNEPVKVEAAAIAEVELAQNAPNPFNPTTSISYRIPESGQVTIDVFNIAGQKVDTLVDGFVKAGSHSTTWDASSFAAGVYFYTITVGDFSKTMKMTLLK
jgi:hypothetical protein